jgi:hypothetical protein
MNEFLLIYIIHSAINGRLHVIQKSLTNCGFAKNIQ